MRSLTEEFVSEAAEQLTDFMFHRGPLNQGTFFFFK